jgi:hypothetical protein
MRRQLPDGVRMYTGDDFNFAELIAGDRGGHSDALLGIFDAIAPAASAALAASRKATKPGSTTSSGPTVPLSRLVFAAPTRFYKTGVVFLAWLNGHQGAFHHGRRPAERALDHPPLGGVPACRPREALPRPGLAAERMRCLLAVHGIS